MVLWKPSLLNSACKVYTAIINGRLKTISDALQEEEQAGFRKARSTTDNIFTQVWFITYIASTDFKKAFVKLGKVQLIWNIMEESEINKLINTCVV